MTFLFLVESEIYLKQNFFQFDGSFLSRIYKKYGKTVTATMHFIEKRENSVVLRI